MPPPSPPARLPFTSLLLRLRVVGADPGGPWALMIPPPEANRPLPAAVLPFTWDLFRVIVPWFTIPARARLLRLERKAARQRVRGRPASNPLNRTCAAIAKLKAGAADIRKDRAEQASTSLARRFDVIRVEALQITNMTRSAQGTAGAPGKNVRQKVGLNRGILASGWGLLVKRLEDKAPGRVEKINPA